MTFSSFCLLLIGCLCARWDGVRLSVDGPMHRAWHGCKKETKPAGDKRHVDASVEKRRFHAPSVTKCDRACHYTTHSHFLHQHPAVGWHCSWKILLFYWVCRAANITPIRIESWTKGEELMKLQTKYWNACHICTNDSKYVGPAQWESSAGLSCKFSDLFVDSLMNLIWGDWGLALAPLHRLLVLSVGGV